MKSRAIFILTGILVFLLSVMLSVLNNVRDPVNLPQHEIMSSVPEIRLDTGGNEIPGEPVLKETENGQVDYQAYVHNGDESVACPFSYTGEDGSIQDVAYIHIRGNSSRYFEKKSYAMHFMDADGKEKNISLAGLPASDEWVLNGPYLDRTLLRNYICLNLSAGIMEYAPRVRFVNLYMDDQYCGLYVLMETIKRDEDRVNITKASRHRQLTSWIIKLDRPRPDVNRLNSYTDYTLKNGVLQFDLCYPGRDTLTELRQEYVLNDVSRIEKRLYSYDVVNGEGKYADDIDVTEFAKYFVINEFFGNMDAGFYSTYYYRDVRGKVKPCVWDFNNACDNYMERETGVYGFHMQYAPWFERLVESEKFTDEVVAQYGVLRQEQLSEENVQKMIDDTVQWLGSSIDENYRVWDRVWSYEGRERYIVGANYLDPKERNVSSYEEAIAQLKDYITRRGEWLDAHIRDIKRFSHPSKTINESLR